MPTARPHSQRPSLSVGQASKMIGVTESTLRQWTDEGKIKAFITPGGHRRFSRSEVREFTSAERRVHGIKDLVAQIELTPPIEMRLVQTRLANTAWYSGLDEDSRARLGTLGRKVHQLVLTCVGRANKHDESVQLAREVGDEFGTYLAEIGVSLVDSMEAFLMHRAPLTEAATDLIRKREALDERAAEAVPLVARITDEVLLALVEAHQKCRKPVAARQRGRR
ncbi:MAG: helix-turn-helix domain-containing protein [Dehalococcoidia bacterium]